MPATVSIQAKYAAYGTDYGGEFQHDLRQPACRRRNCSCWLALIIPVALRSSGTPLPATAAVGGRTPGSARLSHEGVSGGSARQMTVSASALASGNSASSSHGQYACAEGTSAVSSSGPKAMLPASTATPPAVASAP